MIQVITYICQGKTLILSQGNHNLMDILLKLNEIFIYRKQRNRRNYMKNLTCYILSLYAVNI